MVLLGANASAHPITAADKGIMRGVEEQREEDGSEGEKRCKFTALYFSQANVTCIQAFKQQSSSLASLKNHLT